MRVLGIIFLICVASPSSARGAVHVVKPDSSGDFPTIQAAIENIHPRDIVELTDGVYKGSGFRGVRFSHGITIRSQSGDPEACTIDCEGLDYAFYIADGTLEGIGIVNALDFCVQAAYLGNPTIRNCRFVGNPRGIVPVGEAGSGEGRVTVENCFFGENTVGFLADRAEAVVLTDCTFSGNGTGARVASERGYEITELRATRCVFRSNEDIGLVVDENVGGAIQSCAFTQNGIGLYAAGTLAGLVLQTSSFRDNGTGLRVLGALAGVDGCEFSGNQDGLKLTHISLDARITNCKFIANEGGIALEGSSVSSVSIADCLLFGNTAHGVDWDGGQGEVVRCTIVGTRGAGVNVEGDPLLSIRSSIVAFGERGVACGGSSGIRLECTDVFGNEEGEWEQPCLAWQADVAGNFSADPEFADFSAGDLTLRATSPCRPGNHPSSDGSCGRIGIQSNVVPTQRTTSSGIKAHFNQWLPLDGPG